MSDDELDKLADLIVQKILLKQAEYDAEFVKQIQKDHGISLEFVDENKYMIEQEIEKLEKKLQNLLDKEDYARAADIVEQINALRKEL